jgi:hypothetical protein
MCIAIYHKCSHFRKKFLRWFLTARQRLEKIKPHGEPASTASHAGQDRDRPANRWYRMPVSPESGSHGYIERLVRRYCTVAFVSDLACIHSDLPLFVQPRTHRKTKKLRTRQQILSAFSVVKDAGIMTFSGALVGSPSIQFD